jgi:sodium/potassium-transporting ATPase subunit beta
MTERKGSKDKHDEKKNPQLNYDTTSAPAAKKGFANFLYDKQSGHVMGRNCKEWTQLIGFYLIFYTCLFGFWVACMFGFLSTTNLQFPTQLGYQSMLKLNPAIGYRPQPDFEVNLVKFNSSNPSTYQHFKDDLNAYLAPYFDETKQKNLVDCDGTIVANANTSCKFDPRKAAPECFPEASPPFSLGFETGRPCILLKMNRIIGWLPRNANDTTYRDVRVRCRGQNEADVETLGEIEYYPGKKDGNGTYGIISSYYFPYMNQPGYLSPLVFARFANVKFYTLGLIWCEFDREDMDFIEGTYWVSHALNERAGGAHFELVVDK